MSVLTSMLVAIARVFLVPPAPATETAEHHSAGQILHLPQ